ncbi:MAG: AraC family transcriptional regulator ligand-binding domain-containing protein [Alsobacter sp.]
MHLGSLPTTDGTATRLALARLEREGHDGTRLLALSGLSAVSLRRRQRFGLSYQLRFLDLAASALEDPRLGVTIAGELELRELGLLYYVVASASTAREGLMQLVRYVGISNDSISIAVTEADGSVRVSLSFAGTTLPRSDRQFSELVVAVMLRAFRDITREPIVPVEVRFAHPAGETPDAVAAALGVAFVRFDAEDDGFTLDASVLALSLPGRDDYLQALIRNYCDEALCRRDTESVGLRAVVEQEICRLITTGQPTARAVATSLGMSLRTFTRRLAQQCTSFGDILDQQRRDLAMVYLDDPAISLGQMAWLLGYSETTSFNHAFRRWTGTSPSRLRRARKTDGAAALAQPAS